MAPGSPDMTVIRGFAPVKGAVIGGSVGVAGGDGGGITPTVDTSPRRGRRLHLYLPTPQWSNCCLYERTLRSEALAWGLQRLCFLNMGSWEQVVEKVKGNAYEALKPCCRRIISCTSRRVLPSWMYSRTISWRNSFHGFVIVSTKRASWCVYGNDSLKAEAEKGAFELSSLAAEKRTRLGKVTTVLGRRQSVV